MLGSSVPGTTSLATKQDASWGTCLDRQNRPNHREFGLRDVEDAVPCESSLSREQLETVVDVVVEHLHLRISERMCCQLAYDLDCYCDSVAMSFHQQMA
jgi:hypothetical protein